MPIGRPISLSPNIASTTVSVVATSNQTVFIVNGGYRVNEISVYRNGARLADAQDFTARDGTSVTLLSPAGAGDLIEFQIFDTFNVADALNGNGDQSVNGSFTATGGFNIGIQSGGTSVTTGVITALNFIGAGNTFVYNSGTKTVDVSIAGGGGSGVGLGSALGTTDPLNKIYKAPKVLTIGTGISVTVESDTASGNMAYVTEEGITVAVGATFHIGAGTTLRTNALGLF